MCLVAWSLNESETGVDLVLKETSMLFLCKFLLISIQTASLSFKAQATKHTPAKWFTDLFGCKLKARKVNYNTKIMIEDTLNLKLYVLSIQIYGLYFLKGVI